MRGKPFPISVPKGGQRLDLPQHEVPDGFVVSPTYNVVERFGKLSNRPGLQALITASPGNTRMTGGAYFKTPDGITHLAVANTTKWFRLNGSLWTDISGVKTFAATPDNPTQFTTFPSGSSTYIIGVNNVDGPFSWNGTGNIAALTGGPPDTARDVTIAGNRVIFGNIVVGGVRYPSQVQPSDFNNLNSYTAANATDLSDTPDDIIAVRAFQRTQFAIYKDASVWVGMAQASTFPFRYENVSVGLPGPVSPAAVVRVGGQHYYLGTDGRVYLFNGYTVVPISDPVDADLTTKLNYVTRNRAFGVYVRGDRSVWFFYPASGATDCNAGVSYNTITGAWFQHTFPFAVSAGWPGDDIGGTTWAELSTFTWGNLAATYPTWSSFGGSLRNTEFVGTVNGKVYRYIIGQANDDGTNHTLTWTFPLRAWTGPKMMQQSDGIESSFAVASTTPAPQVDVAIAASASDSETSLTYTAVGTHDTSSSARQVLPAIRSTAPIKGHFLGIQFSGQTSTQAIGYRGSLFYVNSEEQG